MQARVVYVRQVGAEFNSGLQWESSSDGYRPLLQALHELHDARTRTVNKITDWEVDLKAWWKRARTSPVAWMPEVPLKK